tara:strand:- start:1567 stop:2379 length:813 start_codon:yes stop_codon:yes gene_type:complete
MRISFSGTASSGKTTTLKSFLHTWKGYTTPERTYRDVIKDDKLKHSSNTTTETQTKIRDFLIDQTQSYDKDSNVVFDRCPFDNLVYTLWASEKGLDGFDSIYVEETIRLTKEALRSIDIIFLCRFDHTRDVEDDGLRDADLKYITEIDNIFYGLYKQYASNFDADVFWPKDDSPGVIILPHGEVDRLDELQQYIDNEGNVFGDDDSIFNPEKIDELEELVKQQAFELDKVNKEKELMEKFGAPVENVNGINIPMSPEELARYNKGDIGLS